MQPRYLIGGSTNPPWTMIDSWRDPIHIGISISSSATTTWSVQVTMDDPSGTWPQPILNPSITRPSTLPQGGALVTIFGSSQVGGWDGTSSAASGFCFAANSTNFAIGGISQPITALRFISTNPVAVLTLNQAGPR